MKPIVRSLAAGVLVTRPRPPAAAALVTVLLVVAATAGPIMAQDVDRPTVVIVHGAWGGAWDWQETADTLESWGYETYRATLTGLGERSHLLSPDIDLTTHVTDVTNLLRWEQLEGVILVGHSYGGMVITGVAEAVPERIARLVYLDAFLPFDGECAMAVRPDADPEALCTDEAVASGLGGSLMNDAVPPGWVPDDAPIPRDVPHPAGTLSQRIDIGADPANGIPAGYIVTRETAGGQDDFDFPAARAAELGWPVVEFIGDHVPYRQDPAGVARTFLEVARAAGR